jgi:mRNA interferase RelE/StbE
MFEIVFLDKAVRDLKRIDRAHQRIIKAKLLILAENPAALKANLKRLGGAAEGLFRLRVGTYRVIFWKDRSRLIILIVRIGHRRDVYADLKTDGSLFS